MGTIDLRHHYRAVSYMSTYGVSFRVQHRPTWWPFWLRVAIASTEERAREYADNHSRRHSFIGRIISFGRLPASNRP